MASFDGNISGDEIVDIHGDIYEFTASPLEDDLIDEDLSGDDFEDAIDWEVDELIHYDDNHDDDDDDDDDYDNYEDSLEDDMNELTKLCQNGSIEPERKEKRGRPCGSTMMDLEVQRPAKKKKMQLLQVEKLVAFLCCSMVCLSHIPQASLRKTRDIFQAMGLLERSRWVMEWFHTHTREDSTTTFTISGYNVCWKAWITCIGLPMSTYYNLKKKFLSGIMLIDGPGKKYGTLNMSSQFTLSWLTVFAQKHADKMPDSTKLHLPCCLKKTNMYELMVEDAHSKGEKTVSMRHFFRLWKRFLPHIVIPKRSRFTVCDICNRLKMKISMTSDKKTRSALTALRDQHLRQQNKLYKT